MPEPASIRERYRGEAVDVSFDPVRCRHAADRVRGLGAVFNTDRRPWILPDGAGAQDVVRVVARCPTGALRTHPITTTASEHPMTPTEVTALPDGPVLLRLTTICAPLPHGFRVSDRARRAPASHLFDRFESVDGITLPTRHRIHPRDVGGRIDTRRVIVAIDVADIAWNVVPPSPVVTPRADAVCAHR